MSFATLAAVLGGCAVPKETAGPPARRRRAAICGSNQGPGCTGRCEPTVPVRHTTCPQVHAPHRRRSPRVVRHAGCRAGRLCRAEEAAGPAASGAARLRQQPGTGLRRALRTPPRRADRRRQWYHGAHAGPAGRGKAPFATVIKDARRRIRSAHAVAEGRQGLDRAARPSNCGQPFLLSPKIKSGISRGLGAGRADGLPVTGAGGPQVVEFVRVHNQVRLQARNASPGRSRRHARGARRGRRLLAQPARQRCRWPASRTPRRKSVLVEANGAVPRRPARHRHAAAARPAARATRWTCAIPSITAVRGRPTGDRDRDAEPLLHRQRRRRPAGAPPRRAGAALPRYAARRAQPARRPALLAGAAARTSRWRRAAPTRGWASSRTTVLDFGDDLRARRAQRCVNRWRLEKKDPAAEVSEPVKPITFWIDRNVPLAYRDDGRARASWSGTRPSSASASRDAIVVQQQADDADFDTLDVGVAVGALDDERRAGVRRHRAQPRRPAQRRDPRRRHRLRRPVSARACARGARSCWAARDAGADAARWRAVASRRAARPAPARRHAGRTTSGLPATADAWPPSSWAMRSTCSRRAATSTPTAPEAEQFVLDYVKDVDRCTRSATRSACATTSAPRAPTPRRSSPTPTFTRATAPPAR
ncbi:MAG: hypothetical protein MZW92_56010 [Comamonadaceae bacterium]|nr:hypothetical protein [Comamonadaceae bacterium]